MTKSPSILLEGDSSTLYVTVFFSYFQNIIEELHTSMILRRLVFLIKMVLYLSFPSSFASKRMRSFPGIFL